MLTFSANVYILRSPDLVAMALQRAAPLLAAANVTRRIQGRTRGGLRMAARLFLNVLKLTIYAEV